MLNYSIYKWVNWVNQYITNSYPSLCVTYTNWVSVVTLYSVKFCCTILYLCESIHMSNSKLYSCLCQAQDYYHYIVILEDQCNDPGFYQILGEIFFVFILLVLIENSLGFKTFWVYLKALFENYLKSSIYFLKNFFEKDQVSKYYFPSFIQTLFSFMQACLQKIIFTKFALFNMGCLYKP
jgi:hypothetical protein